MDLRCSAVRLVNGSGCGAASRPAPPGYLYREEIQACSTVRSERRSANLLGGGRRGASRARGTVTTAGEELGLIARKVGAPELRDKTGSCWLDHLNHGLRFQCLPAGDHAAQVEMIVGAGNIGRRHGEAMMVRVLGLADMVSVVPFQARPVGHGVASLW